MDSKLIELLKLIEENPDLPVVPLVDSEVVAEDNCAWWLGRWGSCMIDSIYIGNEKRPPPLGR